MKIIKLDKEDLITEAGLMLGLLEIKKKNFDGRYPNIDYTNLGLNMDEIEFWAEIKLYISEKYGRQIDRNT